MSMKGLELYVSLEGNDRWSGRLAEPNIEKTDGPFATLHAAKDEVKRLRNYGQLSGHITVRVREGCYHISSPLVFDAEDSTPVTYAAYPGEKPVISGGKKISGWHRTNINGVEMWVAYLPEVYEGKWYFRQLFVNGERRRRPCVPKEGRFRMEDVPGVSKDEELFHGTDTFICRRGDMKNWRNINDVEVVVLHWWCEERMPIDSINEKTGLVKCSRQSIFTLKDDFHPEYASYFLENVFEGLNEPGEWYLDRSDGSLYYIPMPGEEPDTAEVYAPVAERLLCLEGRPEEDRFVEFLRFEGLTFRYSDWSLPVKGTLILKGDAVDYEPEECTSPSTVPSDFRMPVSKLASAPQAAFFLSACISMNGARYCALEDCVFEHMGLHAIELGNGCMHNRVVGNEIYDIGGGGIKIGGSGFQGSLSLRNGRNIITDNHIHTCGRIFYSAAGILTIHSFGNNISHNHIHDLCYSGISCGWIWGYEENVSKENIVEKNHIHDLGHGLLSDMGGIYTLGIQPGTVVRNNLVHDIEAKSYGGWGIYHDGGSSYILTENNICYNTSSQSFCVNYGRENIIRNNIFAFGKEGAVVYSLAEGHRGFTFERNILLTDNRPIFVEGYAGKLANEHMLSDMNIIYDISGKEPVSGKGKYDTEGKWVITRTISMDELYAAGNDCYSIIADPCFADIDKFDFRLKDCSPALNFGFKPIDLSDNGPRNRELRR